MISLLQLLMICCAVSVIWLNENLYNSPIMTLLQQSENFKELYRKTLIAFYSLSIFTSVIGLLSPLTVNSQTGINPILNGYLILGSIQVFTLGVNIGLHMALYVKSDSVMEKLDLHTLYEKGGEKTRIASAINSVQTKQKCCGVHEAAEWNAMKWWVNNDTSPYPFRIPKSCCNVKRCIIASKTQKALTSHKVGCKKKIQQTLIIFLRYNWAFPISLIVAQIIILILACILIKLMKQTAEELMNADDDEKNLYLKHRFSKFRKHNKKRKMFKNLGVSESEESNDDHRRFRDGDHYNERDYHEKRRKILPKKIDYLGRRKKLREKERDPAVHSDNTEYKDDHTRYRSALDDRSYRMTQHGDSESDSRETLELAKKLINQDRSSKSTYYNDRDEECSHSQDALLDRDRDVEERKKMMDRKWDERKRRIIRGREKDEDALTWESNRERERRKNRKMETNERVRERERNIRRQQWPERDVYNEEDMRHHREKVYERRKRRLNPRDDDSYNREYIGFNDQNDGRDYDRTKYTDQDSFSERKNYRKDLFDARNDYDPSFSSSEYSTSNEDSRMDESQFSDFSRSSRYSNIDRYGMRKHTPSSSTTIRGGIVPKKIEDEITFREKRLRDLKEQKMDELNKIKSLSKEEDLEIKKIEALGIPKESHAEPTLSQLITNIQKTSSRADKMPGPPSRVNYMSTNNLAAKPSIQKATLSKMSIPTIIGVENKSNTGVNQMPPKNDIFTITPNETTTTITNCP
ncbi:hypothetical protein HELRODRAFT_182050 [Helobdella robusta]|uniref:Tetraspanin n=1 Tax=Helobdella robusta TaxID=6412 RepID=T1FHN4_HELRO|nr:hypothetical protein HELRODRAFT_182050 [Helobdella robusta]ESN91872.1 hypothetical protein HELRODRAFT_182050 [Helobdella robusta]